MHRGFLHDYDEDGNGGYPQRRNYQEIGGAATTTTTTTMAEEGTAAGDTSSSFPDNYQSDAIASMARSGNATPRDALEAYERQHPRHHDRFSWFVLKLTVTSALGGFLFGYDTGVVSGAMLLIVDDFDLSSIQEEVVVSVTIAAAVTAALAGGPGMERWGRRPAILLAAVIFTVGAVLLAAANSYQELVVGRLVVGLGIGLASLCTPVYIAEAAPSHVRGTLVTLNTLFITVGQVVAGIVDGLFARTDGGWRYMLGLSAVPSLLMTVGFLFLPESPRWLASAGRRTEAMSVLQRIRGSADVQAEMEEMIASVTNHTGGLKESVTARGLLEDPRIRRALVLGCGLQLLQQLSGINTVMYYSATIFSMAGFSESASIWLAAITAAAQSIGVCIGLYFIEKCGRRTLVLSSLSMVIASLVCLGTGFHLYDEDKVETDRVEGYSPAATAATTVAVDAEYYSSSGTYAWLVVGAMMAYLFTFGVGMSSVPWTINAEIYPNHARSLGTSASTTVNWLGNVVVSATFLTLASDNALGKDGAFWLYASIGVAGWIWLYGCMPETKGLSLEEIELLFAREGDPPRPGDGGGEDNTLHPGVAMKGGPRGAGGFTLLEDDLGAGEEATGNGDVAAAEQNGAGFGSWVGLRRTGARDSFT